MNILPKKSWHVRNKANIERVRRDEENARLEEEKRAKRAAIAEQEARTALLRSRSHGIQSDEKSTSVPRPVIPTNSAIGHINFFEDIEQGLKQGSNPEYEAEKKAEQERYEKKIGLLTYVAQSSAEAKADKPWYFQPRQNEVEKKDKEKSKSNKEVNKKNSLDPLRTMKKYLKMKEERSWHQHKKHGRDKHRKHKHKSNGKDSTRNRKKTLEELRAERMRREREEHEREKKLRAQSRGEVEEPNEPKEFTDRYRYNSQFNPDLVRKPKIHHRFNPY